MADREFVQYQLTPRIQAYASGLTERACKDPEVRAALLFATANVIASVVLDPNLDVDPETIYSDLKRMTAETMFRATTPELA